MSLFITHYPSSGNECVIKTSHAEETLNDRVTAKATAVMSSNDGTMETVKTIETSVDTGAFSASDSEVAVGPLTEAIRFSSGAAQEGGSLVTQSGTAYRLYPARSERVLTFDLHPLYASILVDGARAKQGEVLGLDGDLRRALVAPFDGVIRLLVTGTGPERRVKVFLTEQPERREHFAGRL